MTVGWKERYAHMVLPRDEALAKIQRGARIFVGSGCAQPQHLVQGLAQKPSAMADSEILHMLTLGSAPYTEERLQRVFRHNAFFIGDNTRAAVAQGRADYTPVFLSELPGMFRSGRIRLDAALIQVSPPDRHGFVSLGVSVDVTRAAVEAARVVIAEVNPQMPRTLGDTFISVEDIDALVEHDAPVIEFESKVPGHVALAIGRNIAKLIEDGATIQIGIGSIPSASAYALASKRELGVHTEVFSDWLPELVRCGAVTGRRKTLHRGKVIASFCMGSRALYDFVDDNPMVEFYPSDYCNDPNVIAKNDKMAAINTAVEVDLTGQVCSDSIGHQFYSGIGGQVDFVRGASRSRGGKVIIALASTAKEGKVSTIVPELSPGAGVVTTRGSVRFIVTEWGWADLQGKSIRERALALVNIAHPAFREQLLAAAKTRHYVYQDQILPPPGGLYPEQYEQRERFGEHDLFFRPVKPTDEPLLKEMFYSLSDDSIYKRYFSQIKIMPHERLQEETNVDYDTRMALVALMQSDDGNVEQAVGLGQYVLNESTSRAELAVMVRDDWHGLGLGSHLVRAMIAIAKEKGVEGITAVVWPQNRTMLNILYKLGYTVKSRFEDDAYKLTFDI